MDLLTPKLQRNLQRVLKHNQIAAEHLAMVNDAVTQIRAEGLKKNQGKLSRAMDLLTPKLQRNLQRISEHSQIAAEHLAMANDTITQIMAAQALLRRQYTKRQVKPLSQTGILKSRDANRSISSRKAKDAAAQERKLQKQWEKVHDRDGSFNAILRLVSTKLTRWDAIYFTEVASRGYIFEQEWAWGLGFTKLINFFANALQQTGSVDYAFKENIAGIIIAHAAHGLSVLVLYCLGRAIFPGRQGRMLAFIAACLHIFSPAGLFLSAPYGESTYALLSFTGSFLFVQSFSLSGASTGLEDAFLPLAGIMFGLATSVRSNGLLNGILFLEEAIRLLYSMTRGVTFAKTRRLFAVGIAGVCTALGFVIPQYIAYRDFCVNYPYTHGEEPRIWCRRTLPSIYSFVQEHYWNNGFLRYWTLSNIPLFALASPMLAIMTYSALWTLNVESGRLAGSGRLLRSLAAPQLILTILTFANHHVQIITRMSSGYPVWYFWIADLLMKEYSSVRLDKKEVGIQKQRSCASLTVTYMIVYAAVQGVLFASFLPPA
ncbi:hypothetical protein CNMCM5793_005729 [Aspergillus hiratsukae]|uniref:GPI mannosyltransferase 2 n=1 Tax=Aspergillus hiratsukae TaxID=1194566 RepID=A0A8H6QHR3_9EURO|nr:hypothetical protein CNMCM5793_005729 [Aspergillus hiratsukae]KAF7172132.1 hypothetical protein CNMCM6106_006438 [Aspergillus hiratsukae]